MSKCSKKCNEIKQKIDSISGLDDDYVYGWLKSLESVTSSIVSFINAYADRNELNGSCFKENEIDIDSIQEIELSEYDREHYVAPIRNNADKVNELVRAVKHLNKEIQSIKNK